MTAPHKAECVRVAYSGSSLGQFGLENHRHWVLPSTFGAWLWAIVCQPVAISFEGHQDHWLASRAHTFSRSCCFGFCCLAQVPCSILLIAQSCIWNSLILYQDGHLGPQEFLNQSDPDFSFQEWGFERASLLDQQERARPWANFCDLFLLRSWAHHPHLNLSLLYFSVGLAAYQSHRAGFDSLSCIHLLLNFWIYHLHFHLNEANVDRKNLQILSSWSYRSFAQGQAAVAARGCSDFADQVDQLNRFGSPNSSAGQCLQPSPDRISSFGARVVRWCCRSCFQNLDYGWTQNNSSLSR